MAQRAAVGVSVLEFRGVTSLVIVQDSTPKFEAMSIEKSDFTACSQVYSCMPFSKPLLRSPFLCLLHRNFSALLTNCAQERDYAVWNGREQEKRRRLASEGSSYHPF